MHNIPMPPDFPSHNKPRLLQKARFRKIGFRLVNKAEAVDLPAKGRTKDDVGVEPPEFASRVPLLPTKNTKENFKNIYLHVISRR